MTGRPGLLELYDEALAQVYGYLVARCRDPTVAQDLTADTFLAGVAEVRKGAVPSTPWLIGIARHKLVDHWRRQAREQRLHDALPVAAIDDPWEERVDALRAHDTLRRLSPDHRAALTLRYVDDLPVPQVAEHLGRTLHATEALLVRARNAFRRIYDEEGPE